MSAVDVQAGKPVPHSFKSWFDNDRSHTEDWRRESELYYDFVAGRQWTDEEQAALKAKARPIITFNRTGVVVDSIHGHEIGNRREVRYIPREMGDVKANELLTGAGEWFRDQSQADDEESDAFLDTLICGMGWTETRIDFDENDEGDPVVSRIDPMEMYWDFNARKRNIKGSRRVWRVRAVPLSEAEENFEGYTVDQLDASWAKVFVNETSSGALDGDGEEAGDRLVTIVQVQWVEKVQKVVAIDPMTGAKEEFSKEEFETLNKRLQSLTGAKLTGYPVRRKVRKQAFLGSVVLKVGDAPCPKEFSFQCITGKRDRNKRTFFGVVRAMVDPQKWANKWLSQMMHIMNSNSKGGLLAEKGAFEDQRQAEKSWSDPSAITWMNNGALASGKVKEKSPPTFPVGFQQLTEFAISSIRDTTGVSVEMLGMREANQASSLEFQRRQAGMTILQPLFDSLKHYREQQGRVVLHYIQEDLSDGRLIRIVGKEGERFVPLMRQASSEYDIIVDDSPTSPNQKEAAWALMMQLMPMVAKSMTPELMATLLEYSPLPTSVVQKIQNLAKEQAKQAQPMKQAEQQIKIQEHKASMAKTMSEAKENEADAALTSVRAQKEGVEALLNAQGLTFGLQ